METLIKTQYNIGDTVYIADCYYDFYANQKPYIIKEILIDINSYSTSIQYEVEQEGYVYQIPESWVFATYEECIKWCEEHN
jgi:small-conductance mechanosensitive channel